MSSKEIPALALEAINNEFKRGGAFTVPQDTLVTILSQDEELVDRLIEDWKDFKLPKKKSFPVGLDTYERDWVKDVFAQYLGFSHWPHNAADDETLKAFPEALAVAARDGIIEIIDEENAASPPPEASTSRIANFVNRLTESEAVRLHAMLERRFHRSEFGSVWGDKRYSVVLKTFDTKRYSEVLGVIRSHMPTQSIAGFRESLDRVAGGDRTALMLTPFEFEANDFAAALKTVGATVEINS